MNPFKFPKRKSGKFSRKINRQEKSIKKQEDKTVESPNIPVPGQAQAIKNYQKLSNQLGKAGPAKKSHQPDQKKHVRLMPWSLAIVSVGGALIGALMAKEMLQPGQGQLGPILTQWVLQLIQ